MIPAELLKEIQEADVQIRYMGQRGYQSPDEITSELSKLALCVRRLAEAMVFSKPMPVVDELSGAFIGTVDLGASHNCPNDDGHLIDKDGRIVG